MTNLLTVVVKDEILRTARLIPGLTASNRPATITAGGTRADSLTGMQVASMTSEEFEVTP